MKKYVLYFSFPLLIALAVASVYFLQNRQQQQLPETLDASVNENVEPIVNRASALRELIGQFAAAQTANFGITALDLSDPNSEVVAYNGDTPFPAASLYKLFVAYRIYQRIDQGTSSAQASVPGTSRTTAECLDLMITVSNNECGVGFIELIGWEELDEQLLQDGFEHTILNNSVQDQVSFKYQYTTANDVLRLLERLYSGTLLSEQSTSAFIELLVRQTINDRFSLGLPEDVTFAHKTGELDGYLHDAGIAFTPDGNYLLIALSGPWSIPQSEVSTIIATLAQLIDEQLRNK